MERSAWAQKHYDSVKDDPEYLAARLMIEINDHLYARMQDLGLTQRDLAKRIKRSQPYVWKLLNHGTNMTLKTLVTMAQALDLIVEPPRFIPKEEYEEYDLKGIRNEIKLMFTKQPSVKGVSDEDFEDRKDLKQEGLGNVALTDAA